MSIVSSSVVSIVRHLDYLCRLALTQTTYFFYLALQHYVRRILAPLSSPCAIVVSAFRGCRSLASSLLSPTLSYSWLDETQTRCRLSAIAGGELNRTELRRHWTGSAVGKLLWRLEQLMPPRKCLIGYERYTTGEKGVVETAKATAVLKDFVSGWGVITCC